MRKTLLTLLVLMLIAIALCMAFPGMVTGLPDQLFG